jgi:hypothetical protein
MKATRLTEIDVPAVPTEVHVTNGREYEMIDIGELSDETLTQLAAEWTKALVAEAAEQRRLKTPQVTP